MFQGLFRSLNDGKLNFQIFIEDLPREQLTARSALWAYVKDCTVTVAEKAFFAIIFLTRCYFRISLGENQENGVDNWWTGGLDYWTGLLD